MTIQNLLMFLKEICTAVCHRTGSGYPAIRKFCTYRRAIHFTSDRLRVISGRGKNVVLLDVFWCHVSLVEERSNFASCFRLRDVYCDV